MKKVNQTAATKEQPKAQEQPKVKKTRAPRRRDFLVNGRYDHAPFGGLPMPKGIAIHGFATTRITEEKGNAGITEEQALSALTEHIGQEVNNLVVESVSVLPAKW